ncbi:lectin-like [Styela clava]
MKLIIFVTLCQCLFNLSFAGEDGYCFTKWKNGRWVSVGDCDNPSAEDFLKKLRANVARKEVKTWTRASNGLYYKLFSDPATYATAKSNCQNRGGDLASVVIRNSTVFNGEILPMIKLGDIDTWIGLDDLQHEGRFIWADGEILPDQYSYWGTDQPDNHENQEDCAQLHKGLSWKINDVPCTDTYSYICEIKLA